MSAKDKDSKRKRPAARAAARGKSAAEAAEANGKAQSAAAPASERPAGRARARASARPAPKPADKPAQPAAPVEPTTQEVEVAPPPAAAEPASGSESPQTAPGDLLGLLRDIDSAGDDAESRRRAAEAISRIAAQLYPDPNPSASDEDLLTTARQLLSASYYIRQVSRLGMRGRSEQVDDFGLDQTYEARVQPLLDALYARYFRVGIQGVENIPQEGGALLVCNHSGTLPWDGVMLKTALRHALPGRRSLRWLTDDYVFHAPFLGAWLNRIGAVRACPENAERLLERGELLAVFPEGVKGIGKPYRERYQLQRFGRGGHIKLALRMGVPLIPVGIVGAEETYPLLHKVRAFSKLLGMPFFPITPLFPWLGPLGLVPLPSRWQIQIGEPTPGLSGLSARAGDTVLVNELNERVRGSVQGLLTKALEIRGTNAFF